jgi:hypothetical protein
LLLVDSPDLPRSKDEETCVKIKAAAYHAPKRQRGIIGGVCKHPIQSDEIKKYQKKSDASKHRSWPHSELACFNAVFGCYTQARQLHVILLHQNKSTLRRQ